MDVSIFTMPFFYNSLIVILLSSILSGLIGTYIVTRRLVFLSGGISHASFGGIGIGYFLGINPLIGAAGFSLLTAFAIHYGNKLLKLRFDSVIGILWSLGMALGVVFIYLTPGYVPDLMSYLFGSILLVSKTDILLLGILTLITIIVFSVFYYQILFISFDAEYAHTKGVNTNIFDLGLLILVSLVIVANIRVAGIVLVIALLTIPANIANIFTNDYKKIMVLAMLFSLIGSLAGLLISFTFNIPSGASIVLMLATMFLLCKLCVYVFKKKKR